MNYIVLVIIFLGAIYTTSRYGPARTFSLIVLPTMLYLATTMAYKIANIPAFDPVSCIAYGTLIGMALGRRVPKLTIHPIDYLIAVMTLTPAISGWLNVEFWTFINMGSDRIFWWFVPYMLGRMALSDPVERARALKVLCIATPIIGFLALLEWRLLPNEVSRFTNRISLTNVNNEMVLKRFAFFRSMVFYHHPIDHGNMGVMTGAMIVILAYMSGKSIWSRTVMIGLGGSLVCIFTSMSFTSYLAAAVAVGLVYFFFKLPSQRWVLPLFVLFMVGGMLYLTNDLLSKQLNDEQRINASALQDSLWIRALIVQRAWEFAQQAGFFGFEREVSKDQLALESVDNSYMLFIIRFGWIYLAGWVILLASFTVIAYRMFKTTVFAPTSVRLPVITATCALLGVMCGMYTVWFGFTYSYFFMIILGMFITLRQMTRTAFARSAYSPMPGSAARGFGVRQTPRVRPKTEPQPEPKAVPQAVPQTVPQTGRVDAIGQN